MGVVIEICVKCPGGRTRTKLTDTHTHTHIYIISPFDSSGPPGYFIQISITTPVVSALKNCYMSSFLEVPSDILYHFWIQVADLPLKPPRGRFQK